MWKHRDLRYLDLISSVAKIIISLLSEWKN